MPRTLLHFLPAALLLAGGCAPPPAAHRSASVRQHVKAHATKRPDAPQLKRMKNGHYKVRNPWTVEIGGRVWQVPAGYNCNGITAPDRVKASLGDGVDHPETWAAVFHDWLFTQKGVSRAQADAAFHDLLLAYGVPSGKASMMHSMVSAYSLSKSFR
jgi:Protein of unknown function (DUF1353)